MNPNHYRFARTWRDATGQEHIGPLPERITFLACQRPGWCGVAAVVFVIALCVGYFWR